MPDEYDLESPDGMRSALGSHLVSFQPNRSFSAAGLHCPNCGDKRRVYVVLVSYGTWEVGPPTNPVHAHIKCLQCLMRGEALIFDGPRGDSIAIHWPRASGIATPNTPDSVAYYLDEAAKCEGADAKSAAAAMYRAALDHILFDQNYRIGMLGKRIEKLVADVKAGTAPTWALSLDKAYLEVISKIGNGAIHTNDGDVTKQANIDEELLSDLRSTIAELLNDIYELPAQKVARLAAMQAKAEKLKK
jgi:hypothetical protein